jgi:hypothetical protein
MLRRAMFFSAFSAFVFALTLGLLSANNAKHEAQAQQSATFAAQH